MTLPLSVIAAIAREDILAITWRAYLAGYPMSWLKYGEDRL